jgi:hypothetical protein
MRKEEATEQIEDIIGELLAIEHGKKSIFESKQNLIKKLEHLKHELNDTKYKAYLKQYGDGCDYSIGCGIRVIDIEANNTGEAAGKLALIIMNQYCDEMNEISEAQLYEVSETHDIPVDFIYKKQSEIEENKKKRQIEEQERKEFERLKSKYS